MFAIAFRAEHWTRNYFAIDFRVANFYNIPVTAPVEHVDCGTAKGNSDKARSFNAR